MQRTINFQILNLDHQYEKNQEKFYSHIIFLLYLSFTCINLSENKCSPKSIVKLVLSPFHAHKFLSVLLLSYDCCNICYHFSPIFHKKRALVTFCTELVIPENIYITYILNRICRFSSLHQMGNPTNEIFGSFGSNLFYWDKNKYM